MESYITFSENNLSVLGEIKCYSAYHHRVLIDSTQSSNRIVFCIIFVHTVYQVKVLSWLKNQKPILPSSLEEAVFVSLQEISACFIGENQSLLVSALFKGLD